jgi:chromosome segregation protein
MLKALELSGFKSFADRTRFEFPRGISVVVGPNGSGKSNIVDAVKWVLGSQSAKSLRGREMTDVIFNGCASRAPVGTGEATLTLDNADGRLPIDAKEVHVTRRVYRSGEGEYLINRQPCRLRDIRDLLAGTGITTEAYCIIEQGKVDALLQSSPRDRRVIFEEAAGISQFKAKKAAAQRRMERVEQNLLRLSDIVDEVESRLRSVRAQAGKARRYRECAERLQQLRTEVGLVDWRALTKQLAGKEAQLADLRQRAEEQSAALEKAEAESHELERSTEAGIERRRELEAAAAATREQIAAREATVENQRARHVDLQQEVARLREQLAAMGTREDADGDEHRTAAEQLRAAELEFAAADAESKEQLDLARQAEQERLAARDRLDRIRAQASESARSLTSLHEHEVALRAQLAASGDDLEQHRRHLAALAEQRDAQAAELARYQQAESESAGEAQKHEAALRTAEERLVHVRRELAAADRQQRQLEERLTRIRERIAVLTELEERLEGLADGVQEALRLVSGDSGAPLGEVRGLVADLFHVDVDSAPLVEMALGERTQFIVVASAKRLLEHVAGQPLAFGSRVGFLSLEDRSPATALDHVDLSAEPGVMGRADRFVEAAAEFEPLVRRLLGRTWLVDRLATALRLAQTSGRGLDFVTSDGELLASDGTLIIGPRHTAAGMLSRRSELRACHEQVSNVEIQLARQAEIHSRLDEERVLQEKQVASSVAAYTSAAGTLAESRQHTAAGRVHLERIVAELRRSEQDIAQREEQRAVLEQNIAGIRRQQTEVATAVEQFGAQLDSGERELAVLQDKSAELQAAAMARQIAAAKCEQRVEMLRHQAEQAERGAQQREQALAETRQRLADRERQVVELDEALLGHRQALAELFLQKEQHAEELNRQSAANDALRQQRAAMAERIRAERQQLSATQSQQHKLEVAATRLRHERQTLSERMQDDYGIDLEKEAGGREQGAGVGWVEVEDPPSAVGLADSTHPTPLPAFNRDAVEREIAELRSQINNIGAINLDALDELEQLEARFEKLSTQYRDLVDAKTSLERIVQRINVDSRQLFLATVEMVRGHFGELFRRLFGGGEADIVLDEAEDVLECGIEIVGRPPGKEACSISLLSGGEKTLTCVALLLAVFRSKPSPFCVLDEVDAALDEANIGRFTAVLREFLSFTQFIVVTHSKKTMAGADTLYGVTMEESGVSKRVSVRFEDVSEDGQISAAALQRAA